MNDQNESTWETEEVSRWIINDEDFHDQARAAIRRDG